jgi:hypothetical protein
MKVMCIKLGRTMDEPGVSPQTLHHSKTFLGPNALISTSIICLINCFKMIKRDITSCMQMDRETKENIF